MIPVCLDCRICNRTDSTHVSWPPHYWECCTEYVAQLGKLVSKISVRGSIEIAPTESEHSSCISCRWSKGEVIEIGFYHLVQQTLPQVEKLKFVRENVIVARQHGQIMIKNIWGKKKRLKL